MPWQLLWRGTPVGTLTATRTDFPVVICSFQAEEAFAPLRPIFEEKEQLAAALEDREETEMFERFDQLEEQTSPPSLTMVDEQGKEVDFGLLHVAGDFAGFRGG
jgi:hypothetical protein